MNVEISLFSKKKMEDNEHRCEYCDKCFETSEILKNHQYNAHESYLKSALCNECNKTFDSVFELKIHKNTNHVGKISSDFNPEPDKGKEIKLSHIVKENTIRAVQHMVSHNLFTASESLKYSNSNSLNLLI